jgi:hypothetical protein
MNLNEGDKIASLAKIAREENGDAPPAAEAPPSETPPGTQEPVAGEGSAPEAPAE